MAERVNGAAAGADAVSDDDEIPDYVLAYLQTEEGQRGENIPDHVMEYIQKQAKHLGRQELWPVSGQVSQGQEDGHVGQHVHADGPADTAQIAEDCATENPPVVDAEAAEEATSTEMEVVAASAAECEGVSELHNDEMVTSTEELQVDMETIRPEPEGAAAVVSEAPKADAKKSKKANKFDLRSISLPHLPEMPSMAGIKLPKLFQSSRERAASQKSVGDQKENVEDGAQGAKPKRRFRSVSFRQKMRDEMDPSGGAGPEKKFSLSSISLRRWSQDKDKVRDESASPIRQKIREHLNAWNTREVVETKFNLSDFKIRGRNREKHPKDTDAKRTESMSPIRKKIQQEWEAWNTRTVVETPFNASDFKIRGRKREKEGKEKEVKRTESMSPLRQKIQKEWDAWNSRGVVETKFSLGEFKIRGRRRDKEEKEAEAKRTESLSPIRKMLRDEWEAWNTRQVVETKFSMKDFKMRRSSREKSEAKSVRSRSKSKDSAHRSEIASHTSQELIVPSGMTLEHEAYQTSKEEPHLEESAAAQAVDVEMEVEPAEQAVGAEAESAEQAVEVESADQEEEVEAESVEPAMEVEAELAEQVDKPMQVETSEAETEESEVETESTSKSTVKNAEMVETGTKVVEQADVEMQSEEESELEEEKPCAQSENQEVADVIVHQSNCESANEPEEEEEEEEEEEGEECKVAADEPKEEEKEDEGVEEANEEEGEKEETEEVDLPVPKCQTTQFDEIVVEQPEQKDEAVAEEEKVVKSTLAARSRQALQATKAKIQTTLSKDNLQATRHKLVTKTEATRHKLATKTAATRQKLATKTEATRQKLALKTEETRQKLATKTEETRQKLATTTEATRQKLQTSTKQLQAAGQKLQSTLSKQNLQATGQKIQTKLSGTLGKKKKDKAADVSDVPPLDVPVVVVEEVSDIEEPSTELVFTESAEVETTDECADIFTHEDMTEAPVEEVDEEELESEVEEDVISQVEVVHEETEPIAAVELPEDIVTDELATEAEPEPLDDVDDVVDEEIEPPSAVELEPPQAEPENFDEIEDVDEEIETVSAVELDEPEDPQGEPENFDEITIDQMTIHGDESEALISTTSGTGKRKTLADRGRKALQVTKSKIQTTLSKDNLQATRNKLQTTRHRLQSTLSTKTLATRQKLQTTLSKQNLQATGQMLQSKLSDTLIKRRRTKSKTLFTERPDGDTSDRTVFQVDLTDTSRQSDEMSTPKVLSVPRRTRRKTATDVKVETPKLSYPTAKRRLKKTARASAQLTYSRLLCDEDDLHEDLDEPEDELEPKLEFHLHETHHERPPSVSQSTNTIPEDGFESDKENGFRSRSRASKTSFSDPWKGYPPYENVMYEPPPRRVKRLDKAPDSPRLDWHQTWPRKDVTEKPDAPKRVKRTTSMASDYATSPRRTYQAPQRSRSEFNDDAMRDIEKQIVMPIPVKIAGESEIVGEPLAQASSPAQNLSFDPIFKVVKTEPVWQLAKRVPFAPVRLRKRSSSRLSVSTDLGSEILPGPKSAGRASESMEWTTQLDDDLDDPHYAEIKDFQVKTPSPTHPPLPVVSPPSADFYTIPRRKPRMHTSISPSPERPSGTYCTIRPYRPERRSRPSSTDFSHWEAAEVKQDPRRARTVSVPPRIKSRGSSVALSGPPDTQEAHRQVEVEKPVTSAPEAAPAPAKSEGVSIAIQTEPLMDYQTAVQRPEIMAIIANSQLGAHEYRKLQEEIALEIKLRKELEAELEDYSKYSEEPSQINDLNRDWKAKEDRTVDDEMDSYNDDFQKGGDEFPDEEYQKSEGDYLDEDMQKGEEYLDDEYQKEDAEYLDDEYQKGDEEEEYADEEKAEEAYSEEEILDEEEVADDYEDEKYEDNGSPSRSEDEYLSRSDGKRYERDYSPSEDVSQSEEDYDGRYRKEEDNVSRSEEAVSRSEADVGQLEDDLYRFEQQVGLLEKDLCRFEEDLYRSEDEVDVSQYDKDPRDDGRRGGSLTVNSVDAQSRQVSTLTRSPKSRSPAYMDDVPAATTRLSRRDWNETWPRKETSVEGSLVNRKPSPSNALSDAATWRSPPRSPVPPPFAPQRSRSRSQIAEPAPPPVQLPIRKPERPSRSQSRGLEPEIDMLQTASIFDRNQASPRKEVSPKPAPVPQPTKPELQPQISGDRWPKRAPFAPQRSRSRSQNYDSVMKPEEPVPVQPPPSKEKSPEPELPYGREHYAPRRSQTRSVERTPARMEEPKPRVVEVQRSVPQISPPPPAEPIEASESSAQQLSPRPKGVERPRSPWPLGVAPSSPTNAASRVEPVPDRQLSRADSEMDAELEADAEELEIDSRALPKSSRHHKREPFKKEDFRRKLAELPSAAASLLPKIELPSIPNPMTVMRKREVPKKNEVRHTTDKSPSPAPLVLPMPTQTISVVPEQPAPKPPAFAEPVKSEPAEQVKTPAVPEPPKEVAQPSPPLRKPPATKLEYSWRKSAELRAKAAAEASAKPAEPEAPVRAKTEPLQPTPTPAPIQKELPLRRKKLEPAAQPAANLPEVVITPSVSTPAAPAPRNRRTEVPVKKEPEEVVKKLDVHQMMKGCACPSCRPVTVQAPPAPINEDPDFCYLLVRQALAKAANGKVADGAEAAGEGQDEKPEIEIIEINGSSSGDPRTMKLTVSLLILLMVVAAVFLFYTQKLANDWERLD